MPETLDFTNPEVAAAIEARAAELASQRTSDSVDMALAALVARQGATPQVIAASQVTPTSLGIHHPPADEVTLQFTRFTLHGNTSYMAGQQAGFPGRQADELVASRHAVVAHRQAAPVTAGGRLARRPG